MLKQQVIGEGSEPVLFLHGFLGQGRNLRRIAQYFLAPNPDHRAYLIDLPGHGRSDPLPPEAGLDEVAAMVLAAIESLPSLRIIGHSLGGRVALAMLGADPDRVSRVDLLDITPGRTHKLPSGLLATLLDAPEAAETREAMTAFFLAEGVSEALTNWITMNLQRVDDGVRWSFDRQALAAFAARNQQTDLWPVVEEHGDRVHLVYGADSAYVPSPDLARLRGLGVPCLRVPGVGHFLHVEDPRGTCAALSAT